MKFLTDKIFYDGIEVTDIFKRFKFLDKFKGDIRFYHDFYIPDNMSPEHIAFLAYESTDWWWLVLLFNEILDPFFDWPLSYMETETWAKKLIPDWETNPSEYFAKIEEIETANNTKRKIKLLRATYLNVVVKNIRESK